MFAMMESLRRLEARVDDICVEFGARIQLLEDRLILTGGWEDASCQVKGSSMETDNGR